MMVHLCRARHTFTIQVAFPRVQLYQLQRHPLQPRWVLPPLRHQAQRVQQEQVRFILPHCQKCITNSLRLQLPGERKFCKRRPCTLDVSFWRWNRNHKYTTPCSDSIRPINICPVRNSIISLRTLSYRIFWQLPDKYRWRQAKTGLSSKRCLFALSRHMPHWSITNWPPILPMEVEQTPALTSSVNWLRKRAVEWLRWGRANGAVTLHSSGRRRARRRRLFRLISIVLLLLLLLWASCWWTLLELDKRVEWGTYSTPLCKDGRNCDVVMKYAFMWRPKKF